MNNKKCLLVIDVQKGMFTLSLEIFNGKKILGNIRSLIEKARSEKALVVYNQFCGKENSPFKEGTEGWKIHPIVAPEDNDTIMRKTHPDSFQDTRLDEILKSNGISELVICGLVTEAGVDTTIRRAFSLGYSVEVAGDCHSTTDNSVLSAEQIIRHHNQVFKIFSSVKYWQEITFKNIP